MINPEKLKELNILMKKVKVGLISKGSTFLTTVGFNLKFNWDDSIPTAATNGLEIKFNPDFFESLTKNERIFVYAHEIYHVVFMHMIRCGTKDKTKYNVAGDFVINSLLKESGFNLVKGSLYNSKYRDWSTEAVYADLPEFPPPPPMLDIQSPGEDGESNGSSEELEQKIEDIVLKAVTASKMSDDKPGSIPGEIEDALDKLINPVLDWKTMLNRFMNDTQKEDFSWRRPNRRFLPSRMYLPTMYSERLEVLTYAIDLSCSVSDEMMVEMFSEINYVKETLKPEMIHIIIFDIEIRNVYEIKQEDDLLGIKFTARGGTSFNPWMNKYITENKPVAMIVFSDMQCAPLKSEPECPILWIAYDCPNDFKVQWGEITHYTPNA